MLPGDKLLVFAYKTQEHFPIFWRRLIQRFIVLAVFGALIVYVAPLGVAEESPPSSSEIEISTDSNQETPTLENETSAQSESEDLPNSEIDSQATELETSTTPSSAPPSENSENLPQAEEEIVDEEKKIDCDNLKDEDELPEECEVKAAPLNPQPAIRLIAPFSLMVDPRAKMRHLPSIEIESSFPVLVCIFGSGTIVDVGVRGLADAIGGKSKFLVSGDLSSTTLISGENSYQVASFINGSMGLPVYSSAGIVNKGLSIRVVALNKPSIDLAFCSASSATRYTTFRALDIGLYTKKAPVPLVKK